MVARFGKRKKEMGKTPSGSSTGQPERISNKLEHKLVIEDKPIPWYRQKRNVVIIVSLIIVVIGIGGFIVWSSRKNDAPADNKRVVGNNQCLSGKGYELAKKAGGILQEANKEKQLEKLVKDIQKIPDYEQDPVCLVPVVKHHIHTWKLNESKEYLAKLEAVYDRQKVSDFYGLNYDALADLKKALKGLETAADNLNKGVIYPPVNNEKQ